MWWALFAVIQLLGVLLLHAMNVALVQQDLAGVELSTAGWLLRIGAFIAATHVACSQMGWKSPWA